MVRSYTKSCEGVAKARREIGSGQSADAHDIGQGNGASVKAPKSIHAIVLLAIMPFSYIKQTCTRYVEQPDLPF